MDYKEKYEQALERAKVINPETADYEVAVKIFPELKESDDEKIRKRIIEFLSTPFVKKGMSEGALSTWIAWLEKVGRQKPADKFEPKFKVGDWIQYRHAKPFFVEDVTEQGYVNGDSCLPFEWEDEIHIWTIQDAKDGDVLYIHSFESDCVFLYQNTYEIEPNRNVAVAYCCIDVYANKIEFGIQGPDCIDVRNIKPAAKEQRDLLFQKMKEAGYEWDAENKELKKIEQTPISIVDDWIEDYWKHYKVNNPDSYDKGEEIQFDHDGFVRFCQTHCPKPAWSEEDEYVFMNTYELVKENEINPNKSSCAKECLIWLKSLKQRMKGE